MPTSVHVDRDAVGQPRDLGNEFINADMKKTPFTTWVPKGAAPKNSLIEQPVEKFASVDTSGATDESDVTAFTNPRDGDAILNIRVQTWERAGRVGGRTQSITNQPGITPRQQLAKAIAKTLTELKRNIEATLLSDNESAVGTGGPSSVDKTRGLGKWLSSTAQTHYPVDTNYLTPSASIDSSTATADYTDKTITTVFKSMFDQHGNGDVDIDIWAGSTWKQGLDRLTFYSRNETNMTQVRRFDQGVDEPVRMFVDVLATSFGTARVRTTQFINTSGDPTTAASKLLAYATIAEFLELRMSQTPTMLPLARTGRNQKYLTYAEGALVVTNPLPLGKFAPGS